MTADLPHKLLHALMMAAGMVWQTGWTLVLGFTISAALQATVSSAQMQKALGKSGWREIALATAAGAASSSCSYASAAIMHSLFKKAPPSFPRWLFCLLLPTWFWNLGSFFTC
jgi:hypothetical protein